LEVLDVTYNSLATSTEDENNFAAPAGWSFSIRLAWENALEGPLAKWAARRPVAGEFTGLIRPIHAD
jgi:hypothetical protein